MAWRIVKQNKQTNKKIQSNCPSIYSSTGWTLESKGIPTLLDLILPLLPQNFIPITYTHPTFPLAKQYLLLCYKEKTRRWAVLYGPGVSWWRRTPWMHQQRHAVNNVPPTTSLLGEFHSCLIHICVFMQYSTCIQLKHTPVTSFSML